MASFASRPVGMEAGLFDAMVRQWWYANLRVLDLRALAVGPHFAHIGLMWLRSVGKEGAEGGGGGEDGRGWK